MGTFTARSAASIATACWNGTSVSASPWSSSTGGDDAATFASGDAAVNALRFGGATTAPPHAILDGPVVHHPDRWQPGDVVADHFRIVSLLGRGGMGEVYQARDTTLARDVALKVVAPSALPSEDLDGRFARFKREAQVLASLNHVNIAAIYGVTDVDGVRALVLELV